MSDSRIISTLPHNFVNGRPPISRVSASDAARPISSWGTLYQHIQRFLQMHEPYRHLHEIHAVQEDIEDRVLSSDHIVE
jgi:hypothetical protein